MVWPTLGSRTATEQNGKASQVSVTAHVINTLHGDVRSIDIKNFSGTQYSNMIQRSKLARLRQNTDIYSAPDRGAEYCDERVCLSLCVFVCPRSYLQNYTSDLRKILVHVTCGRGSVLLWQCSDTLHISVFINDVKFMVLKTVKKFDVIGCEFQESVYCS